MKRSMRTLYHVLKYFHDSPFNKESSPINLKLEVAFDPDYHDEKVKFVSDSILEYHIWIACDMGLLKDLGVVPKGVSNYYRLTAQGHDWINDHPVLAVETHARYF